VRTVSPSSDLFWQRLILEYDIKISNIRPSDIPTRAFKIVHELLLFTPMEIKYCLENVGFYDVKAYSSLPDLADVTSDTRMLAFICKKR
jgi:hypothetical protein